MPPSLPKPEFKSCDETSLSLKLDLATIGGISDDRELRLQYKLPQEPWTVAKHEVVRPESHADGTINISNINVDDLNPGTPYSIRLCFINSKTGDLIETGPEIVFDTAPVDCTPKKKTCIVS